MPALVFKGEKINLSYVDDALTIYLDFACDPYRRLMTACIEKCKELPFVDSKKQRNPQEITNLCKNVKNSYRTIALKDDQFDRYVHSEDDDHNIYHRDDFDRAKEHYHLKFKTFLNAQQITYILKIFIKYNVLSETEKLNFLREYHNRYAVSREYLNDTIKSTANPCEAIVQFINRCPDNDILADLYQYLLDPKFDYLRQVDPHENKWLGINANGELSPVNKNWVNIEKIFTLRLARNIFEQCNIFTQKLGTERHQQIVDSFRFFAIKHKQLPQENRTNSTSQAFQMGDSDKLKDNLKQKTEKLLNSYSNRH